MKNLKRTPYVLFAAVALAFLSSCAPTAKQMSELLEKNPEILTNAIDKNPEKFMEAVQKAAQGAQGRAQENQAKAEEERIANEEKNPLQPEITDKRHFMGNKSAPITIVEYTDFQCPFCAQGYNNLEQVRKAYGDKVRVLVKNLPLPMHPLAMEASKRFEALMMQSPEKAYAFYHEVFKNQRELNSGKEKFLDGAVKKVGGNLPKVLKDMESEEVTATIAADMAEANKFGISGTPGFVVNGVSIRGAYPFETFKAIIDKKLATL